MTELFRLHLRLIQDRSKAFDATGQGYKNIQVKATEAGKRWLSDYHAYHRLYKKLNGHAFKGSGPADKALHEQFGFVLDDEIS